MVLFRGNHGSGFTHFIQDALRADGYSVRVVDTTNDLLEQLQKQKPELIVVDLDQSAKVDKKALPQMRRMTPELPILALIGAEELGKTGQLLDEGFDDFLVKPVREAELQVRCRALLHRKNDVRLVLRVGDVELNRLEHTVTRADASIPMTHTEFVLLEYLMLNKGRIVTRAEVLQTIWKMEANKRTNIVDVYINYLRKKIDAPSCESYIRTLRCKGYVLDAPCA